MDAMCCATGGQALPGVRQVMDRDTGGIELGNVLMQPLAVRTADIGKDRHLAFHVPVGRVGHVSVVAEFRQFCQTLLATLLFGQVDDLVLAVIGQLADQQVPGLGVRIEELPGAPAHLIPVLHGSGLDGGGVRWLAFEFQELDGLGDLGRMERGQRHGQ